MRNKNRIVWAVLLAVMLAFTVRIANWVPARDPTYRPSWAYLNMVLSLVVALVIGFVVQRLIRRRRGFPWWIAATALAIDLFIGFGAIARTNDEPTAQAPLSADIRARTAQSRSFV